MESHIPKSKKVTTNFTNQYFNLSNILVAYLQSTSKLWLWKNKAKYYNKWITTCDNGNVQSHDQQVSIPLLQIVTVIQL